MHVRVTGVIIDDGRILVLDQDTGSGRAWSLAAGMGAKASIGL